MQKNSAAQSGAFNPRVFLAFILCLTGAFLAMFSFAAPTPPSGIPEAKESPSQPTALPASTSFGKLPLSFERNADQARDNVQFIAHSAGGTLYFTRSDVVLKLSGQGVAAPPAVARLLFVRANRSAVITSDRKLLGKVNYFVGNDPSKWRTNVPTYAGITYRGLFPGIDLAYEGPNRVLKGTYTIAPGADTSRICWRYKGARSVKIDESGNLQIYLKDGNLPALTEEAPVAWQSIDGERRPVSARYRVARDGSIGFAVGRYEHHMPLQIDPTIAYSTYFGGKTNNDFGTAVAVDGSGRAVVVGYTLSSDFPTANAYQASPGGLDDAFITKFTADGSGFVYSTYLGGSGQDLAWGVAVDGAGNAYVTGQTTSTNFPVVNAFQGTIQNGDGTAFVVKLSPDGSKLLYSTYLGGTGGNDEGHGIAVDGQGYFYVTGQANTEDFPTVNPIQSKKSGGYQDGFVTRFNPAGTPVYSTYLGGSAFDIFLGIAADAAGSAYVTGYTNSKNFPTTANAVKSSKSGTDYDAFAAKLNPNGTLVYSTYLGGSDDDFGASIAVDALGNAYVAGQTASSDFPTVNPVQAHNAGQVDAFVAKLNAAGSALVYSTYLGGSGSDRAFGIAVDGGGNAYLAGETLTAGSNLTSDFPQVNPTQAMYGGGGSDAFMAMLDSTGSRLLFSTFLGGVSQESGYGIALDASNNAYVAGWTSSANFPNTRIGVVPPNGVNDVDAFVTKFSPMPAVVSRKTHGTAGTFDINLPLTGTRGIECRSGGANGDYTMIFTFANDLIAVASTSASGCGGSVSNSGNGPNSKQYTVNLTGVSNACYITVTLTDVLDSAGNLSNAISATMGVLIGDTSANGLVNSTDVSQTQAQSGQVVTSSNFRTDVNANGLINSTDVSIVQSKSGTGLL